MATFVKHKRLFKKFLNHKEIRIIIQIFSIKICIFSAEISLADTSQFMEMSYKVFKYNQREESELVVQSHVSEDLAAG